MTFKWRIEVHRRGTGDIVHTEEFEATPLEAERRQGAGWKPYNASGGRYTSRLIRVDPLVNPWLTIE